MKPAITLGFAFIGLMLANCESGSGGLDRLPPGTGGSSDTGTGGTVGGTGGVAGNGMAGSTGEAGAKAESSGAGGSVTATSTGGSASSTNSASSSSTGGTGGNEPLPVGDCVFHTPAPDVVGAGGEGGAGSEDVHIASSNFVGDYLVDAQGISLYIYGADSPGDCNNPPITACYDDCALSWPIFDAGPRSLGEGLTDEAFGRFQRDDGLWQTTYLGWPLYYYKRDEVEGDLVGHGRGRIWFAAETRLPNIMVMRASEEAGGIRYLATGDGFTLYAYAGDGVGSDDALPKSTCMGDCLKSYQPLALESLRPASPIEPSQVTVFVRPDTQTLQVAYNGVPLYTAVADTRSGQLNGVAIDVWSVVEL